MEFITQLRLPSIETLVFAGGGNRCWWQAGALKHLAEQGWHLPKLLVGTSAGAALAAACVVNKADIALDACLRLYAANQRVFDWRGLSKLRLRFAHKHIYPEWISSFINVNSFEVMRNSSVKLRIAFARPAYMLGLAGSVAAGTLAYLADKYVWNGIHPHLPKLLGLRQEFLDINECATLSEAQTLLSACAAAPPFMSARSIAGRPAFDGGYVDNAPIHKQNNIEKASTLVLLTRHYPRLPPLFKFKQRFYWQPSLPVPVSTWDCTASTNVNVMAAFHLGERDAQALVRSPVPGLLVA